MSHIRAVDAIFQVVRCFDDAEIIHVEGDVNPTRDLDIISEELRIKDIEFVEKAHENLVKQTRRGGQSLEMKKLKEEQATVEFILELLKSGKDVRSKTDWSPKEVRFDCLLLQPFLQACFYDEQEPSARTLYTQLFDDLPRKEINEKKSLLITKSLHNPYSPAHDMKDMFADKICLG